RTGSRIKGAMKNANRSGARFTLVVGERDLAEGVAQLKDMESGEQGPVRLDDILTTLQERLV
ncbi:His/Gly/Thr/Pro-type tRNA ligase C-terminal domain-containing protein, partial [Streptomyces sp. NPDC048491]|uniref:His/Gly/Thr/Pro-type tRNA ligase C-terminal domain-containing protein n=1 Tax=Streptomyces sp. NPDC048491 TaxID=3157207 RepID=UPI003427ABEA